MSSYWSNGIKTFIIIVIVSVAGKDQVHLHVNSHVGRKLQNKGEMCSDGSTELRLKA